MTVIVCADPVATERRFWSKVNKLGPTPEHRPDLGPCWVWLGKTRDQDGYGQFHVTPARGQQRTVRAHRYSWQLHNGPSNLAALHKCDNRICVNPDHMFLGTQADNIRDMVGKGRHTHGDNHPHRLRPELRRRGEENGGGGKLRDGDVIKILELSLAGVPSPEIATRFNVDRHTINAIMRGKIWTHITGLEPKPLGSHLTMVTMQGETLSVGEWCKRFGIRSGPVHTRIATLGWDPVRALTTPLRETRATKPWADRGVS